MDADLARAVAAAVDPQRVLGRLAALATFGGQANGGVTRLAFSAEERAATAQVAAWLGEAGLSVAFDPFGTMFGSTDGNQPGVVVSMAGSHLDTVPNGGRFDGALGVVAALESVLAMRSAGYSPPRPLEVVVWRCEEPVRFSQGKAGSLVFSGQLTPADLQPIEDPPFDLQAALAREDNYPRRAADRPVALCLELHIEQGRRLERAHRQIGVVTAVAAPIRLQITLEGSADHSGATPMDERRDALCAAAELILAVERCAGGEAAQGSVATVTTVRCLPGAINVIPGSVTLLVDVRGIDGASMDRLVQAIRDESRRVGEARAVTIQADLLSRGTPTRFAEPTVHALSEVVAAIGYAPLLLASGAGHDAQCLAHLAEVGMLFVPSVGGISHSPEEYTEPDDVVAGVRALAAAWACLSGS